MPDLPAGTVTFLFTDIEGSTQLWDQHARAMELALAQHHTLLREAIEQHAGAVFQIIGDAFCAAFPSAPAALSAALAAQHSLRDTAWGPTGPIHVRMALHTAAVELYDDTYPSGPHFNRIARILSAGHGGQILLSLATEQLVRDHLPPDAYLRDLGTGGLRGLTRTEQIFQFVAPDLPSDFPPLKGFDPRYLEPGVASAALPNPYKGLRAFHEKDAPEFFGREALTERLLARLAEEVPFARFLAVIGPSGSGKSSVVRAGLVPALRQGRLPNAERWLVAEILPGAHPLEELEAVLLSIAVNPPTSLLDQLRDDERGLARAVKRILPRDETVELLLVIDQFEEIFTLVTEEVARVHLLMSLYAAVTDPRSRVRVVITLRADFYDRPLLYPDPGELLRQRTEVVLPLSAEELERAIVWPATRAGALVEVELVAAIVKDVEGAPGALPLLQYALTELFEQRLGRILTLDAYRASGGVLGTLGRRAEEIYAGLDATEQEAARQLFLRLITLSEGGEDTRRRVRRSELATLANNGAADGRLSLGIARSTAMARVIEAYGRYRLLTFDHDPIMHEGTVEVAHEALIRSWDRLRGWLDASRANVRLERQLLAAAREWNRAGRDPSYLASGARLAQFEALATEADVALTDEELAYLEASLAERERQLEAEHERQARALILERRAANRLRWLVSALALFLVLAFGLAAFAFQQRDTAEAERNRAAQAARLATARELAAAATNSQGTEPERSILLALQAVMTTYAIDKTWIVEAEEALHRALAVAQPRQVLHGHRSGVSDVAFSPDGMRMVTASLDGTAIIWDATTGKQVLTLGIAAPAVQSDHGDHGEHAVATPTDDAGHGGHGGEPTSPSDIYSVAYSPDGTRVATAGRDGIARIWDVATGKSLLILSATDQMTPTAITAIAFSPDSARLTAAHIEGTTRVWDLASGQPQLTLTLALGPPSDYFTFPNAVAVNPDGARLATAGPTGTARVWDAHSGVEVRILTGHTKDILDLAFSPDGARLASASYDQTAKIWDVASGAELLTIAGHTAWLTGVAFNPDGTRLATSSDDGTVKVWDSASGQELFTLAGHTAGVAAVTFHPNGAQLATASVDGSAKVWDARPSQELATLIGHTDQVIRASFSPDGMRLATSGADHTARVWDVLNGRLLRTLQGHTGTVEGVAFHPDGQRVATGSGDDTAVIWNVTSGQALQVLRGHTSDVGVVAFSPDGRWLATSSADKTAKIWDVNTGDDVQTLVGHTGALHCLAFSPDGTRLATGGDDRVAVVWEVRSGRALLQIPVASKLLTDIAFSPDGRRVATAETSEVAKVWDAASGELLLELKGHAGGVYGVGFSPDGTRLATASADRTTRIWNASSGEALLTLYGHTAPVNVPVFSPDGRWLATASVDRSVRLYALPIEELVTLARSRLTRSWTPEECQKYLHMEQCPPAP